MKSIISDFDKYGLSSLDRIYTEANDKSMAFRLILRQLPNYAHVTYDLAQKIYESLLHVRSKDDL